MTQNEDARAKRLAEALRTNLRRRKTQSRGDKAAEAVMDTAIDSTQESEIVSDKDS